MANEWTGSPKLNIAFFVRNKDLQVGFVPQKVMVLGDGITSGLVACMDNVRPVREVDCLEYTALIQSLSQLLHCLRKSISAQSTLIAIKFYCK